jgi:glucose-6-phosphate 1-dehydrogenase
MPDVLTGTPSAVDLITFGGAGDTAMRKLIPAVYHCHREGGPAADIHVIAVSRGSLNDAEYRHKADTEVRPVLSGGEGWGGSLRPIGGPRGDRFTVRGQYTSGWVDGAQAPARNGRVRHEEKQP